MYMNNKSIIDIIVKSHERTLDSKGLQLLNDFIQALKIAIEKLSLWCDFLEENSVFAEVEDVAVIHKVKTENANEQHKIESCIKDSYATDESNIYTKIHNKVPSRTDGKENLSTGDNSHTELGKDTSCLTQSDSGEKANKIMNEYISNVINLAADNSQHKQNVLDKDIPRQSRLKCKDFQQLCIPKQKSQEDASQIELDKSTPKKKLLERGQKDNQRESTSNQLKPTADVSQFELKVTPHKKLLESGQKGNQTESTAKQLKSAADTSPIELDKGTPKKKWLQRGQKEDNQTNSSAKQQSIGKNTPPNETVWFHDFGPNGNTSSQTHKRRRIQSYPAEDQAYGTEDQAARTEDRAYPVEDQAYSAKDQAVPTDYRPFPTVNRAYPTEDRSYHATNQYYNPQNRYCSTQDHIYFSINTCITREQLIDGMTAAAIYQDFYEIQNIHFEPNRTSGNIVPLSQKGFRIIMNRKYYIKIGTKHVKISRPPRMRKWKHKSKNTLRSQANKTF